MARERIRLEELPQGGFSIEGDEDVTIEELIAFLQERGKGPQASKLTSIWEQVRLAHQHSGGLPGITDLPFWRF